MESKQLVLDALQNKYVERIPWVPFVGCHAASLIGVDVDEYFKNADHIVNGVTKAFEMYRPDGLPILFDLQLEAEALGCKLIYAKDNPPAVSTHPLECGVLLKDIKIPDGSEGRFPLVLEATRKLCSTLGDKIALYGLITGPFTLALHLKGTDIFYGMIDEPEEVHELMLLCQKIAIKTAELYINAGIDIVAVVDPMTSQISPDSFAEFVSPYVTPVFEYVKSKGKLSSFFVCGTAKRNIEEMCKCKPDGISIDENIPLDYVKEVAQKYDISIGGNIKLTLTMLFGTKTDNIKDARTCMEIGGNKGFILAPGCDIPYNTPPENIKAITSTVHGEVSEIFESEDVMEGIVFELPDYKNSKEVIVDVVTLDSESCAPCQYMMEAVKSACADFGDKVIYKEHKVKLKEGVACMIKLGVKNIPTIVVDGEIKYVSLIPEHETLKKTIKLAIDAKGL